jgi:hypothetical protein
MTTTTYRLLGITDGRGACDHCGRTLSRLFRIATPTGDTMVVGRTCSANLTGYRWSVAQAERLEALRLREEAALADYGDLYLSLVAQARAEAAVGGVAGAAGEGVLVLRDRPAYLEEAERVAFAREMLARSLARVGQAA